jgi:hypothetical protein
MFSSIFNLLKRRHTPLKKLLLACAIGAVSSSFAATVSSPITVDKTSNVRNPMSGWVLYPMEFGEMDTSGTAGLNAVNAYWASQDAAKNSSLASTVYIRTLWSRLEKTEGVYAWNDPNDNWNALVDGAVKRGLKLGFRFYVQSRDTPVQASPQWLFSSARAPSVQQNSGLSPYADDPIFQAKYAKFINAFGVYIKSLQLKYKDPNVVSFVDGSGLGSWGEDHGTLYLNSNNAVATFRWLTGTFRNAMPSVLLMSNYIEGVSWGLGPVMDNYADGAFAPRRDGVGSTWFTPNERSGIALNWQLHPLVAENCYHGLGVWTIPEMQQYGLTPNTQSVRDGLRGVLSDAESAHANLLDLRTSYDAETWNKNPDFVQEWVQQGGYRLSTTNVSYPNLINQGTTATFSSTWQNDGVGIFPNAIKAWSYKYKPAIALMQNGVVVYTIVDRTSADLSTLFKGGSATITITNDFTAVPAGTYEVAVGVVDTQNNNSADIQLAITTSKRYGNWYVVGSTAVAAPISTATIPNAPTKVFAAQSGTALNFTFTPSTTGVPPAYYSICNTTLNKCTNVNYTANLRTLTFTGATIGAAQKYQISACNSAAKCSTTPVLTFAVLNSAPATPAAPVFSFVTGALTRTSFTLNINLPTSASGIQRKEIYIVNGAWALLKTLYATQYDTTFTAPDLQIGTWYGVSMASVDAYGNRSASTATQWIQLQGLPVTYSPPASATPAVPTDVYLQQQGTTMALLLPTLNANNATNYYNVCDNSGVCKSSTVFQAFNTIFLTNQTVGSVKAYRVQACNIAGSCSAFTSNVWTTVLTGSQWPPVAPSVGLNAKTNNSITVGFNTPWSAGGVQRYKINVFNGAGQNIQTLYTSGFSNTYTVTGLTSGQWYGININTQDTLNAWSPVSNNQITQLP